MWGQRRKIEGHCTCIWKSVETTPFRAPRVEVVSKNLWEWINGHHGVGEDNRLMLKIKAFDISKGCNFEPNFAKCSEAAT